MAPESTAPRRALPRHVLVTGADGMIGGALVERLLSHGVEVTALGLDFDSTSPAQHVIVADAADDAVAEAAMYGVDGVAHLAAIAHPSLAPAREVFVRNTSATFTILDRAGAAGVTRAVIAGSINAFGVPMNRHPILPAYFPLDENSPIAHDDAYSLSKWVDEHTARWANSRWGIDVVAFRFPLVKDREALIELNRELLDNEREIERLGREGWSYLVLEDAVDAIVLGLTTPVRGAHTMLLAAANTRLPYDTDVLLDRYAPQVERRRRFAGRESLVDTSVAGELLGWTPKTELDASANVSGAAR
ncbi:MAG TPA: NAD(P)-dependent oxidoreductase [Humibacter sp.]|nr:NAD(P)-dependent oxidoreductase [Humibacter sp.]